MLKDIEGDRPRHGPFRDGPLPSIESILQPQPRSPERLKTVPPRNGTRRGHRYSIVRNRCSVGLKWWDAQGEEHYKNVGQVSDEEAERLAEELTKPIREQVFHAQALAKSRYRETLKNALQPSLFGQNVEAQPIVTPIRTHHHHKPRVHEWSPSAEQKTMMHRFALKAGRSVLRWCCLMDAAGIDYPWNDAASWEAAYQSRNRKIRTRLKQLKRRATQNAWGK